jgi:hypothetical protein
MTTPRASQERVLKSLRSLLSGVDDMKVGTLHATSTVWVGRRARRMAGL